MSEHQAAVLVGPGQPFDLTNRPTPSPGPKDILIQAKAIALNPLDWVLSATGYGIESFPAVLGSDVAGFVVAVGAEVPADAPQPGARVVGMAPSFFFKGAPNYGAFQELVLVPYISVTPLPDFITFPEASSLPMAVQTAWAGWHTLGVPLGSHYSPADKKAVLIWGGSSSVGTAAIQTAKSLGLVVYATASPQHHDYLQQLGATKVFNYKADDVVQEIVATVQEDGVTLDIVFLATGSLQPSQDILAALNPSGGATLASAPLVAADAPQVEGVTVKFVMLPFDEQQQVAYVSRIFQEWLPESLDTGDFVPSPPVQILDGGLAAIQDGLTTVQQGVSGQKLVVEL
ncbi:chaperonin 10-like protein [Aspergillus cavernicola]|uniref:Chaperonin 10-like protein n=1 Tax=Aspergillus cavernicola TaxID=176166 RepID=A0ABR4HEV2_9EURO